MKSVSSYLELSLLVLVDGGGGVGHGDAHQTQAEDEELHCCYFLLSGRLMSYLLHVSAFIQPALRISRGI